MRSLKTLEILAEMLEHRLNHSQRLISELFTFIIHSVHIGDKQNAENDKFYKSIKPEDLPVLNKYLKDLSLQYKAIETTLRMKDIVEPDFPIKDVAHGYFKLLHTLCIIAGAEETTKILARFLYAAKSHQELIVYVSFASSIAMFYPNITTAAVGYLMENHKNLLCEVKGSKFNVQFIKNLLVIVEWHRNNEPTNIAKQIGFCIPDLYGAYHENVLNCALYCLDGVKVLDADSYSNVDWTLSLMRASLPRSSLLPKSCHKVLAQFSGIITTLVKIMSPESFGKNSFDGIELVYKCFDVAIDFVRTQSSLNFTVKRHFLVAFFDEIAGAFHLFTDNSSNSPIAENLEDFAFVKNFRSMNFNKKAAAMAHSGVIKKPRLTRPENANESDLCKRSILVDLIYKICSFKPATKETDTAIYDIQTCKTLGQRLTENVCGDALTGLYKWEDWETEKENIPRHLEVAKKIHDNPIIYDLMVYLADAPYPCIWTISPLIKALLATSIMHFESTPLKEGKPLQSEIDKLDRIFTLFIKSGIAPKFMEVAYELVCSVSNHEVYAILWDLWNFLYSCSPLDLKALEPSLFMEIASELSGVCRPECTPPTPDKTFLVSTMVLVIQRNITLLGHLLPLIVDEESWSSDENANNWDIERLLPVISAPENIKR